MEKREIRIMPMSSSLEFQNKTYEEIQNEFFIDRLIHKNHGYYYFRSKGITTTSNSYVLFQIQGKIIASGTMLEVVNFENYVDSFYKGAYIFDTDSIEIFNPINFHDFSQVVPTCTKFSQVKQKIDFRYFNDIMTLIRQKQNYEHHQKKVDFLSLEALKNKIIETSKILPKVTETSAKSYERNPFVSEYAKRRANGVCELCKNSAPFKNKSGTPYLETHHIIWLSKNGEDTVENTVALCPNCHKKMHILNSDVDKKYLKEKITNNCLIFN